MAAAGHTTRIYIIGTSTSFTGEAFGGSGAGPYTITDSDKSVWDPDTVPTFYDNAVAISANDISSIDYLFGIVTFTGSKTGPITADGNYFPLYTIAECYEVSFDFSRDILVTTEFGDTANTRIYGLLDASASLMLRDDLSTDLDTSGNTRILKTVLTSGQEILLSLQPKGATSEQYRMWAIAESESVGASVDGQIEGSVEFLLSPKEDSAGREASFGWVES